ncbi:hypothetical protein ACQP0C_21205 [Nocardia sp. CA-129566]|uniref:hypothetical protein n=1 Tax=Nocardia sp. CA-129566 TaxID=3239976 RepID=UPI003D95CA25
MVNTVRPTPRRVLDCYWGVCLVGIVAVISYFAVAKNGLAALTVVFPCCVVVLLTIPLFRLESDRAARRHICLVGIVTMVSCFAVANNDSSALTVVFPCCVVVMLTFPWLSRLEPDREARRHILWITAALLISGTVWFPAWWGLGIVAVPAITAVLFGYAFAARAAVLQASRSFDFGDEAGNGDEDLGPGIPKLSGSAK